VEKLYLRAADLFTTVVDGETVLLDGRTSSYLTTNQVGTTILELLRHGATVDEIHEQVRTSYSIDAATAERDCAEFLDQLRAQGLLGESEPNPPADPS
jgi:hypothetical protein